MKADWRFPSHVGNPWGAISDCYALNVDSETAWTCYYTGFPIVRVHDGELTGWDGSGVPRTRSSPTAHASPCTTDRAPTATVQLQGN